MLHLGAQIAIPYSYVNPRDFVEINALGHLQRRPGGAAPWRQRVVHTSTSEVYGSAQTVPITESHPLEPQSPYAASKIAADKLIDSFHRSFDLPVTVLRPFNTYGPRQSARAVIPTIIGQALAGSTLRLGSLHPSRDSPSSTTPPRRSPRRRRERRRGRTHDPARHGHDVTIGDLVERSETLLGRTLEVEADPTTCAAAPRARSSG